MNDSASGMRLPGRVRARWSRRSTPTPSMITTSASSPRARRAGIASGESPTEGPRVVTSLWPVDFSNAGPSSEYTLKKPAEINTLMSTAEAAPDTRTAARKTNTLMKACGTLTLPAPMAPGVSDERPPQSRPLTAFCDVDHAGNRLDRAGTPGRGCARRARSSPLNSTVQPCRSQGDRCRQPLSACSARRLR